MVVTLDHTPTPNTASARAAAAQEARDVAASLGLPPLVPHGVDEGRPVRVIVIGAGFSGLGAAIYLPQQIRNLSLQVYDRADDIGGVCTYHSPLHTPSSLPFSLTPVLPLLFPRLARSSSLRLSPHAQAVQTSGGSDSAPPRPRR